MAHIGAPYAEQKQSRHAVESVYTVLRGETSTRPRSVELEIAVWSERVRRGVECVPATQVEPGRYQLVCTPGLAEGLAAGDVIELTDAFPGFVLVRRGGNFGIWLWSERKLGPENPVVSEAHALAATLKGSVDGGTSRSIVLTVPSAIGFDTIVTSIDRWTSEHPEFVWEFCNAYEYAEDGSAAPLDWWKG